MRRKAKKFGGEPPYPPFIEEERNLYCEAGFSFPQPPSLFQHALGALPLKNMLCLFKQSMDTYFNKRNAVKNYLFNSATTSSPIFFVPTSLPLALTASRSLPAMSPVRQPASRTAFTAFSIAFASVSKPKL